MRLGAAASALVLVACAPVFSSAHLTGPALPPSTTPVAISATKDPPAGEELGIVEAHGHQPSATMDALVGEFRSRVASLGGDYGRIDRIATKYETITERHDYECGQYETEYRTESVTQIGPDGTPTSSTQTVPVSRYVSKTCTEERPVEVATTTLLGRAFRTSRGSP